LELIDKSPKIVPFGQRKAQIVQFSFFHLSGSYLWPNYSRAWAREEAAARLQAKGSWQAQGEIPIKEILSSFGLTFLYRSVQVKSATSCQDGQTRLEPSMGSVAAYPEMIYGIESG
jgi:hypothetical protein